MGVVWRGGGRRVMGKLWRRWRGGVGGWVDVEGLLGRYERERAGGERSQRGWPGEVEERGKCCGSAIIDRSEVMER